MIKQREIFHFAESRVAYTIFRHDSNCQIHEPRRIVLLHGAGVAGELTWTFIVNYLKHWDEVLVPDLLGMGESFFEPTDQQAFLIEDICQSLFGLLRSLQWHTFDLVGYSLGGLVALELNAHARNMHIESLCLIEPALLSDPSLDLALAFRQSFVPLVANIKSEPKNDQYFIDFLDLVSPHRKRSEQIDTLAIKRLQVRPIGFAHALAAVSEYAQQLNDAKFQQLITRIPKGLGIVGELSNSGLLLAQQAIQCQLQQQIPAKHWQIESLANSDHSLVYVRPKAVAGLLNQYLA